MSEASKSAREAMKAKANRLVSEKVGKVDASGWTPPEALNTTAKTGARPISDRLYKRGGGIKVNGSREMPRGDRIPRKSGGRALTADSLVNRDVREANEDRKGIKHVGGFADGGSTSKTGLSKRGARITAAVEQILAEEASKGNGAQKPKKAAGGPTDGYGSSKDGKQQYPGGAYANSDAVSNFAAKMAKPGSMEKLKNQMGPPKGMKAGGRSKKAVGGPLDNAEMEKAMGPDPKSNVPPKLLKFQGDAPNPYKKGGAAEKREARKSGGRTKGKTNINIVISTGKKDDADPSAVMMPPKPPMIPPPPAAMPPVPPMPGAGMPAPGGPPMPTMGLGAMMGRKAGGRVYRSYKDMDAGSGGGLGRLEKEEIQKRK